MKVNREVRRTSAQFLNSLAVAIVVALAITPYASGASAGSKVLVAVVVAVLLHLTALWIVLGGRQ